MTQANEVAISNNKTSTVLKGEAITISTEQVELLSECLKMEPDELDGVLTEVRKVLAKYRPLKAFIANHPLQQRGDQRGRRKDDARKHVLGELRRVFRTHYKSPDFGREKKGAQESNRPN